MTFKSKHPLFLIEKDSMEELWRLMEESFIKTTNKIYDRFVFFSSKQQKGESEKCILGVGETKLIRDTFFLNMLDIDTQKELPTDTVSPTKALEIAIHIEMEALIQKKINQNLNTNSQSVEIVNNFKGRSRTTNY